MCRPGVHCVVNSLGKGAMICIQGALTYLDEWLEMPHSMVGRKEFSIKYAVLALRLSEGIAGEAKGASLPFPTAPGTPQRQSQMCQCTEPARHGRGSNTG